MAISMTLTRCAILIFFLRTLYTKMYPGLRHTGTYIFGTFQARKMNNLVNLPRSALLHHHCNRLGCHFDSSNGAPLPADQVQLHDTFRKSSILFPPETFCGDHGNSWSRTGRSYMVSTSSCGLEPTASPISQAGSLTHLRPRFIVRGYLQVHTEASANNDVAT
jgi:hypothetical protein